MSALAERFRWLEQLDAPDARAWLAEQQARTTAWFAALPECATLREEFAALSGPRPAHAAQASHTEQLPDPTGRLLARGFAATGVAAQTWRLFDYASGAEFGGELRGVAPGSVRWTPDGAGLLYSFVGSAGAEALLSCELRYHRPGTPQRDDWLIYAGPEPGWSVRGELSDDGRLAVILAWPGSDTRCLVLAQSLDALSGPPRTLVSALEGGYHFVGGDHGRLWFIRSADDAPRGALVGIDPQRPAPADWRIVLPPAGVVFQHGVRCGERMVLAALHDAAPVLLVYGQDGQALGTIPSPGQGRIAIVGTDDAGGALVRAEDPARPPTLYRADPAMLACEPLAPAPALPWDPASIVTERHWYRANDGTTIPIWLSYRRDRRHDGPLPTVLEVYGGFGEPATPEFSLERLIWLQRGGLWARPCLRGGGDYGRAWHLAGAGGRRLVTITDALAAAEWLVNAGWCARATLAIVGRSHGGLVAGACLTRRPGLFGAALIEAGILDLVRFDQLGAGAIWRSEYGDPAEPAQLRHLQRLSPLHQVRAGTAYPPTLVVTASCDEWVHPAHSATFAAALQAVQRGPAPVLLLVDEAAAHGAPGGNAVDLAIRRLAFLTRLLYL